MRKAWDAPRSCNRAVSSSPPVDPMAVSVTLLLAADLLSVEQQPNAPGCFSRKGRPVKMVEVVGVVVSVERRESYAHFKVDDGTGCVPCILWTNQHTSAYFAHRLEAERDLEAGVAEAQAKMVRLGRLLRVVGKMSSFRDQIQITVTSVAEERDSNIEVLHWMQCIRLALRFYDLPFSSSTDSDSSPSL